MNSIILTDEEISTIKSLTLDVVDIPVIECIYVKPIIEIDESEPKVEVRVLLSDSVEYNTLFEKLGVERDVPTEINAVNLLSRKYNDLFGNINDGRCELTLEWSKDYVPWLTTYEEGLAAEELVNGTIVYDRFEKISYAKNIVGLLIERDPNLPLIENIDEVTNSENKNSSK